MREYVKDQGCCPVSAKLTLGKAELLQTVPPPLTLAVGSGFTVTVALPEDVPEHPASLTAVTVYAPAAAPVITYGLVVIPVTGVCGTPPIA